MKPKNALKYASTAIAIIALAATMILAYSPTQAQNNADSDDLAKFVAIMQYIRSQPTPTDVNAANIPLLATLDTSLSDIYITGFITPFTGETPEQVKARLQSVPEADRFTAVMVESYRLTSNPLLLDITHQLLPLYYVEYFTTAEDLNASAEFLKRADIQNMADAFNPANYAIPAPSATQAPDGTSTTHGSSDVDSDDLARFVAIMQYIRSTPTPTDVNAANIPLLATLDTSLSDIYITGFITPFTGETPEQVKARLQSVPEADRFTAVMVESYRLTSNPLLLNIIHQLLPLYYVEYFTTAEDLNASAEFLKRADIQTLADAFNPADYAIPAPPSTPFQPPDTGSPATDRAALIALYNATDGPNWENNTNWLTDKPLEEWHGVSVDGDGRVTDLSLRGSQMSGEIPAELGNLTKLTRLALYRSNLSGSIPPELGNLSNLENLFLYRSNLSGSIPPELGNLSNLENLFLYRSNLSGSIPPELGNLSNLRELFLNNNQLTGSIPPELANLSNLRSLWLNNNQLSGAIPPELGNVPRLLELTLAGNQLTGCIPNALLNLLAHDFAQLGLSFCSPVASDPSDRAVLKALYEATDGENWENNTNWGNNDQPLALWHGVITDSDGRVTRLSLRYNQLSGSIPPELGSLANLEWLYLEGNQLSGSIPPELGNLSNLREIWLSYNQLSGNIPQNLTSLAGLQEFHFGYNDNLCAPADATFTAWLNTIPEWSGPDCEQVKAITSDRAALVALYNATDGPNWSTSTNWLTDKPLGQWHGVGINQSGRVDWLWLSGNQLSGPIPSELGNLANLDTLDFGSNHLTGGIPSELGDLANLEYLFLGNNQLDEAIPADLGDLAKLIELDLRENQLSGSIPADLGDLTNLEYLNLSDNELSGTIPSELGGLSNLARLRLSDNQLTGCIPSALQNVQDNDLDNLGLPFCAQ